MNRVVIRILDVLFSLTGLVLLLPLFAVLALLIAADSRGGIFFSQVRVGRQGKEFRLLKFRTMKSGSEKKGQITVGTSDSRITGIGRTLRNYKLDELPQLMNVISGEMSLVGPRPEVPKYVAMYTAEQRKVLEVKPGITDYASIEYSNENEILGRASDPEKKYVEEVMPAKINLNLKFIQNPSLENYFRIIFLTLKKIV